MRLLRRNLSLMLAVRYLNPLRTMFSVITFICLGGVALGVMVLIVVLSVMEGLQREMESRVLAFAPHYVVAQTDGMQRVGITDDVTDWGGVMDSIRQLPDVVSVYPQLEGDAFAQSRAGRMTVQFSAIEPHNAEQVAPLQAMLRDGTFDFGEGLDAECVISAVTATALNLRVGESLHMTPVGSLDEVADIYAMIQNPLQTHENKAFMQAIATLFDGTQSGVVDDARLEAVVGHILKFDAGKLRQSEKEYCSALYNMAQMHRQGKAFAAEQQKEWQDCVAALAALDRDKEDGKAVKSINEMVMPIDLRVVGIYQTPENMPGPNIYMPLQIAQDVLGFSANGSSQVQGICVRVKDPNNPGTVETDIENLLPQLNPPSSLYPTGLSWYIAPWTRSFEQWYELIANERVMMSFVLSIISLIASFCIMAVMFTMSMQRKREIAVLQALGATPSKIMGIFAWQGVIIGTLGAVLGVILALLVLYYRLEIQAALASIGMDPFPMQAHGITLPAVYDAATFAQQAVQAFIMVTIAAIIPAFVVSRQDPAKALRSN
ncbi:MAG: ABC transporter permease [Akkermansia sp.]|nr:ABC transporter permease [Akkermansia sp.]MBR2313968.1 ABC transporter permease [Akkermansia sp.]